MTKSEQIGTKTQINILSIIFDCELQWKPQVSNFLQKVTGTQALQLFKSFNNKILTRDWIQLDNNIINTTRQTTFATQKSKTLKVGMAIDL